MEKLDRCPACGASHIKFSKQIRDHFKSGEEFGIFTCYSCGLMFTNPRPSPEESGAYYQSDDYISHSNKRSGLLASMYQFARKRNLKWKAERVHALAQVGSILDIGCGTGEFPSYMRSLGWGVTGVEPDAGARLQAAENHKLDILKEDDLSGLPDASFDVITMWHVLEHVHPLRERMAEVRRLLRPGAYALIALPNPVSWDALVYDEHWAGWDVPRHLYHFPPPTLISLFQHEGFGHLGSYAMKFDAYYISMLSERYRGTALAPFRGLASGWRSNLRAASDPHRYSSTLYIFMNPPLC